MGESPIRRIGRFTTERPGACRRRKGARGLSSPGIEPMGLNEDEPQLMSLEIKSNRSRRVAGVMMKADVCVADNRQPTQSPAGVGVAGTSGRATTDKAGRVEPMSQEQSQAQSEAQAGSTGEAAGVGSAVGG